jgi:2-alkenal reductase
MTMKRTRALLVLITILAVSSLACGLSIFGNSEPGATLEAPTRAIVAEPLVEEVVRPGQEPVQGVPVEVVVPAIGATDFDLQGRLIELYQQVNPSVVHILVYLNAGDTRPVGSGSGFLYDENRHVVTNNHVVQDGSVFELVFFDGNRTRARVIGTDVDSDLAVLQLDSTPEGARPLRLGSTDETHVGQFVVAIGNPFGEQGSMTLGIVSGLGRSLESQRILEGTLGTYSLPGVIQTDAPINPGNSGGPLLNLDGEVIGINSAIRSTTGVNSGVGFAIPVDAVARIVPSLIEDGGYSYSYLGVTIESLNLNSQERYGLPQVTGAYLTRVTPGSPADEAGLIPAGTNGRGGDLIVAIDGAPIIDTQSLIGYLVFKTSVGQTVELTVLRGGETVVVPVTLGERP